jgi:hypothetical protein
LGNLLEGAKAQPSAEPVEQGGNRASHSPGLAALLHGPNAPADASSQAKPESPQPAAESAPSLCGPTPLRLRRKRLFQASLVLGDVVLLGLAAGLFFNTSSHLGCLGAALCVAAVLMGAWLTCLALWLEHEP